MTDTPHLGLPIVEAAQAQKHVTHNEALTILDALVMLAVLDRDLSAPPASPAAGDRYLVKSPGTGGFAGKSNQIAHYADGAWFFYPPQVGWTCYVQDDAVLLAWDGTAWQPALQIFGGGTAQNLSLLGVGTTADATNPLSAKLNNALWTAKTVAEGGDGHLRYKLSKESAAKTLSFLFQDNFSGRAEIGLTGDDDFHFKVSADGTTWLDAIAIDRSTGKLTLGQGFANPAAARAQAAAAPLDALAFSGMQINGGMNISQENGTTAVALSTGTPSYIVDNWQGAFARAATLAISCQQVTPPGSPSFQSAYQNALQMKATTGLTPLASGDYAYFEHLIEGYRTVRLNFGSSGAQPVSVGFWVYATIAGTMTVALVNSAANRSIPVNVTINNAATWEYKTVTFAGDTAGTWLFTTGIGLRVRFCFGAGSTYQGTNNTWTGSQVFATSSTTNFFASTNNLVCITGVVVLPGVELPSSDRAPFIMRPFDQELRTCRRYYQIFGGDEAYEFFAVGTAASSTVSYVMGALSPAMRALPAVSVSNVSHFQVLNPGGGGTVTSVTVSHNSPNIYGLNAVVASGLLAGVTVILQANNTLSARLKFDARL